MIIRRLFLYHLILTILRNYFNTLSHLLSGNYHVVTRSKTKGKGTQLPKEHGVNKVLNPLLKSATQEIRDF